MRLLRAWPLLACLLPALVFADDDAKITITSSPAFDEPPTLLFYFEDSPALLSWDEAKKDVWRSGDDGVSWERVDEVKGNVRQIWIHPLDPDKKRAVILGKDKTHYATDDKGATWNKFEVDQMASVSNAALSFHKDNPEWVLYTGSHCSDGVFGRYCEDTTFYTKDWFKDKLEQLREDTHGCVFARGTEDFEESKEETVLCIVDDDDKLPEHRRLMISDIDDFIKNEKEPALDGSRPVRGVTDIASVTKFIVVAVRVKGSNNMQLYVSDDAEKWDRAEFPSDHGGLKEEAYTILESTPYSIQVDVLTTDWKNPMGELFTSNSNGTYFTRNIRDTNRAFRGTVDFEQIKGIDGIVLVNTVENADEVGKSFQAEKQLVSKISFDDGKDDTWLNLQVKDSDLPLHLHSVTELTNAGRVYSSDAPGLVMGIGNVGDHLKDYTDGDLYVSQDAGLTWFKGMSEAHKYEFGGSGSILVAIEDEGVTDKVIYSTNFGEKWHEKKLGKDIRARLLMTTPDSTSMKFVLVGTNKEDKKHYIFALDFSKLLPKCGKDDFEDFIARRNNEGEADCLMGHQQKFRRRKKDAECYVDKLYEEPRPEQPKCPCEAHDFECDFNYVLKDGKCVIAESAKLPVPSGKCRKPDGTFMGPSGYRKIPGNVCEGGIEEEKLKEVETPCKKMDKTPNAGDIVVETHSFSGQMGDYFYLRNTEESDPDKRHEVIILRTRDQHIHISSNHGKEWREIEALKDVKVTGMYPHEHNYGTVYFTTASKVVYFSVDMGETFSNFTSPALPTVDPRVPLLDFHPDKHEWLIWAGRKNCETANPVACRSEAYYSTSQGEFWNKLTDNQRNCKFVRKQQNGKLVYCERYKDNDQNGDLQLVASSDFFEDEKTLFERIIGFATMEEFIIVAGFNGTSLKASASIDGETFADAHFPPNVNVPVQTAYTVLDSSSNSVFLHLTTSPAFGSEFGSLLKSNSNGTNYVLSLDAVNRNEDGYVDFEKMRSVEGVAIVNRVTNPEKVLNGEPKMKKTMITHNDGGNWAPIKAPVKDSNDEDYDCNVETLSECSLNLHGYTERTDPRHTYASQSAIGFMMGVGNVGPQLTGFKDGNTFLTTDAGITWKEVAKGQYLWEYGDQGSIIVIVDRAKPTDRVLYSLNNGENWEKQSIDEEYLITDISTVPSDTSRKFLLWGYKEGGSDKFFTIHLDFSGITTEQCDFKPKDEDDDDFEDWYPKMPDTQEKCLFGHEVVYRRKIPERRCYVGRALPLPKVLNNCTCDRADFECDFNYERQSDGTCELVKGLEAPDHEALQCKDGAIEYYPPTGYRRLPKTTCQDGHQLDKTTKPKSCPGMGDKYKKKHKGIGGFGLFLAIVLPICAAAGVGWYVWSQWVDGRFGAIRLGDDYGTSQVMQYPVMVLSAIVAVVAAIPTILSVVGGWLGSKFTRTRRYTTRSSFARGNYSIVNNDEGELLGSDDEDEV